jgi:hypothetical protein
LTDWIFSSSILTASSLVIIITEPFNNVSSGH